MGQEKRQDIQRPSNSVGRCWQLVQEETPIWSALGNLSCILMNCMEVREEEESRFRPRFGAVSGGDNDVLLR